MKFIYFMESEAVVRKSDAVVIIHNIKERDIMDNCLVKWTKLCVYLLDTTFCVYRLYI